MSAEDSFLAIRSQVRKRQSIVRFLPPSQLRRLREGEQQVAAVCYRLRGASLEFLLVRTRGGRWTFPKGGAESGLTHAQAAALEAYEEAGVHGRMGEASFARYTRRKRGGTREADIEIAVNAYLCEVVRLGRPREANRNPTWFSAEKAKRRLQEERSPEDGAELARVVDRAVERIHRLRTRAGAGNDALQKVQFEPAPIHGRMAEASFVGYIRRQSSALGHSALELAVQTYLSKALRHGPAEDFNRDAPRLSPGKKLRRANAGSGHNLLPARIEDLARPGVAQLGSSARKTDSPQSVQIIEIDQGRRPRGTARAPRTDRNT